MTSNSAFLLLQLRLIQMAWQAMQQEGVWQGAGCGNSSDGQGDACGDHVASLVRQLQEAVAEVEALRAQAAAVQVRVVLWRVVTLRPALRS